jgi:hypothetical protein
MTNMGEYEELFKFAAKAGSLEGYLYERESVEPLHDWVSNIEKMYAGLPDNIKGEIRGEFGSVPAKISTYGEKVLGDGNKKKLNNLLSKL